ncbi:FecR family protein [Bacteriovoracaceae bacterium]|nr:FecR family protein [Bacteriovoracaceae bacterium]
MIRYLISLIALILLVQTDLVFPESFDAKIIYAKGNIELFSKRTNKILHEHKEIKKKGLRSGDTIKIGKKSLAILSITNSLGTAKVKLVENTSFSVSQFTKNKPIIGKLNSGASFVKFVRSTIQEKKTHKTPLIIKASRISMGVRGTEFFASFSQSKVKGETDVWMCVNEGNVLTFNKKTKQHATVPAGQGVRIKNGQKITDVREYEWTKKLNWNMDAKKGSVVNEVDIKRAYYDLLETDYD